MASDDVDPTYVDTPYGMVTASGRWYHIPEEDIRAYASDVLEHVSLDRLINWADAWLDSPRTVTLWLLPPLLWALPVGWAVAAGVGLYGGWTLVSPSFPGPWAAWLVSGLQNVLLQGGYYVLTLSAFALADRFAAVGVGLLAFVLLRWGIVGWGARLGLRPLLKWLYPLPVTDQVLRALILRSAVHYRVSVSQVDALTADIIENLSAQSAESDESIDRTHD